MRKTDYSDLAKQYAAHRQVNPKVVELLAQAVHRGRRILEVGCGTGNYLAAVCALRYPSIENLRSEMHRAGFRDLSENTAEWAYEVTDTTPFREKVFSVSRYALLWGTKPTESLIPNP